MRRDGTCRSGCLHRRPMRMISLHRAPAQHPEAGHMARTRPCVPLVPHSPMVLHGGRWMVSFSPATRRRKHVLEAAQGGCRCGAKRGLIGGRTQRPLRHQEIRGHAIGLHVSTRIVRSGVPVWAVSSGRFLWSRPTQGPTHPARYCEKSAYLIRTSWPATQRQQLDVSVNTMALKHLAVLIASAS